MKSNKDLVRVNINKNPSGTFRVKLIHQGVEMWDKDLVEYVNKKNYVLDLELDSILHSKHYAPEVIEKIEKSITKRLFKNATYASFRWFTTNRESAKKNISKYVNISEEEHDKADAFNVSFGQDLEIYDFAK